MWLNKSKFDPLLNDMNIRSIYGSLLSFLFFFFCNLQYVVSLKVDSDSPDQTACMGSLILAFAVHI